MSGDTFYCIFVMEANVSQLVRGWTRDERDYPGEDRLFEK